MMIKIYALLLMAALASARASMGHEMDHCGASMVNGMFNISCDGYYSIIYKDKASVMDCEIKIDDIFRGPVEVLHNKCFTILLGFFKETETPSTSIHPFVLWPISVVVIVFLILAMAILISISRLSIKGTSKITYKRTGVEMVDEGILRKFPWTRLLILSFLCKPVITTCVSPMRHMVLQNSTIFQFTLDPGQSACFTSGRVTHLSNEESLEISKSYITKFWSHHVWSSMKCGHTGDCGTTEECAAWGSRGRIVRRGDMIYNKICSPHGRSFFVCPHLWGCWLATLEVSWSGEDYVVYQIGTTTTTDITSSMGLEECFISQRNLDPVNFRGSLLVVSSNGSYLCPVASETNKPTHGKLGDIQIGSEILFDFNAFQCELDEPESSGGCKVAKSFIEEGLPGCSRLPLVTSQGEVSHSSKGLLVKGEGDRFFEITCPNTISLVISEHGCFNFKGTIEGVYGTGQMYLTIMADSLEKNSSVTLEPTCMQHPITVVCDSVRRVFKLDSDITEECFDFTIDDKRHAIPTESWEWDSGDHSTIIRSDYHSYFLIGAIIVLALIVVRMVLY